MEMRAKEDVFAGEDLTPAIPPLAFSLSDHLLSSHCSACSAPLPNPQTAPATSLYSPNCPFHPHSPTLYCSPRCCAADTPRHLSSSECHLLRSLPSAPSSDLRLALRLLLSLPELPPLPLPPRLAGLLTNQRHIAASASGENSSRIREGAAAMEAARRMRDGAECAAGAAAEEAALCLVLTNGVEVHVGAGNAVGTAVYGLHFSWFNHSCSPNACYRFEMPGPTTPTSPHEDPFRVAATTGSEEEMVMVRIDRWLRLGPFGGKGNGET